MATCQPSRAHLFFVSVVHTMSAMAGAMCSSPGGGHPRCRACSVFNVNKELLSPKFKSIPCTLSAAMPMAHTRTYTHMHMVPLTTASCSCWRCSGGSRSRSSAGGSRKPRACRVRTAHARLKPRRPPPRDGNRRRETRSLGADRSAVG